MASVFDVAAYILEKRGQTTHMKLQKLAYYAQAWSLVWDEAPLFAERIEAWANGPVVPDLFARLQGKYAVSKQDLRKGTPSHLSSEQKETIDRVLDYYGDRDPQWLSDLTHMESPWLEARRGLSPGERSNHEITHAAMADYYSSL